MTVQTQIDQLLGEDGDEQKYVRDVSISNQVSIDSLYRKLEEYKNKANGYMEA